MDKHKGKLSIYRRGIIGEDFITIELEDSNSYTKVVNIDISLDNLMRALTNLASVNCRYEFNKDNSNLFGKIQEVKTISMPSKILDGVYDKESKSRIVKNWFGEQQFLGNISKEWSIKCDGTDSRQDIRGEHRIILCRFVDKKEV